MPIFVMLRHKNVHVEVGGGQKEQNCAYTVIECPLIFLGDNETDLDQKLNPLTMQGLKRPFPRLFKNLSK